MSLSRFPLGIANNNPAFTAAYNVLHGTEVVHIGDSITEHYNASANKYRWATRLSKLAGYTEINLGVAGKRLDTFDWAGVPVKTGSHSVAIIALGINDLFENSISAANYKSTYQSKIDYMLGTKMWDAESLVLATPGYVNPTAYSIYTGGSYSKHMDFIDKIYELAAENVCQVADVYKWMIEYTDPTVLVAGATDYIHLTNVGHSYVANAYYKRMKFTL